MTLLHHLNSPVDAKIDIRNWLVLEWPYSSCHFQLFRQIYPEFCALKLLMQLCHWQSSLIVTSQLAFDFTAPSKLSAKTCPITRLQQLFPLPILLWHIGLVLRFISIYDTWKIWNDQWGTGYIPVFTVWKYLVSGIYQRGDLKLKSVKISVQGPFKLMGIHVIIISNIT